MKVLHGMTEVAGQNYYSVKGLKEIGVKATSAVWRENSFGYPTEINIGIGKNIFLFPWYLVKMVAFFLKATIAYDCFHFHFRRSLLPLNLDLWILKFLKKKIFFELHGSEIRGSIREVPYKYFTSRKPSIFKKWEFNRIAKYADGFILHDAELIAHLPDKQVPTYIVPLRMDIDSISPNYPLTGVEKPIIVHAPSDRKNKGTEYFIKALEELDIPFEMKMVEGVSQEAAFREYEKADVIFDQISVGTYGVFAIEAMALGKPVLVFISEEMRSTFPESLPVISVEPHNLKGILLELLKDSNLRCRLGKMGRKYAIENHDYRKNAVLLKEIYERVDE